MNSIVLMIACVHSIVKNTFILYSKYLYVSDFHLISVSFGMVLNYVYNFIQLFFYDQTSWKLYIGTQDKVYQCTIQISILYYIYSQKNWLEKLILSQNINYLRFWRKKWFNKKKIQIIIQNMYIQSI